MIHAGKLPTRKDAADATTPPHSASAQADMLARDACAKAARSADSMMFAGGQGQIVITAVSQALTRALLDPQFGALPDKQKTEAATLLAEQVLHGQRLIQALNSALNNPSTLATQLKHNTQQEVAGNVFETIIDATRERVTPQHSEVAFVGTLQ